MNATLDVPRHDVPLEGRSGFAIELTAKGEDPSAVSGSFAVTGVDAVIGRASAPAQTGAHS